MAAFAGTAKFKELGKDPTRNAAASGSDELSLLPFAVLEVSGHISAVALDESAPVTTPSQNL